MPPYFCSGITPRKLVGNTLVKTLFLALFIRVMYFTRSSRSELKCNRPSLSDLGRVTPLELRVGRKIEKVHLVQKCSIKIKTLKMGCFSRKY